MNNENQPKQERPAGGPPQQQAGSGYGGYYGSYYYGEGYSGYGYGYGNDDRPQSRNLKDYLLILRERIWWLVVTVFIFFMGTAVYTFNTEKIYRAGATVQVLRTEDTKMQFQDVVDMSIKSNEDFLTQMRIIESGSIVQRVADRLTDSELRRFMAPYESDYVSLFEKRTPEEILAQNRKVEPIRMTLVVAIFYHHPDPEIAARIANYFAEEYIHYNTNLRIEGSMRAVEDLKGRAEQQRAKVEELELQIAEFKGKYSSISFDRSTDIDQQEILRLNDNLTQNKRLLDEAQTQWQLVEQAQQNGTNLWDLGFIAAHPRVASLLERLTQNNIEIAALSKNYREKHPRMITARQAEKQTLTELSQAVESASNVIHNNYIRARRDYENGQKRLDEKQSEIIELQKVRVEYSSLVRNLEVNQEMYNYLYSRMQQTMTMATDDSETARFVDRAGAPRTPHSPNIPMNLAIGLFAGMSLGLGLVYLLAVTDDKVKTAYDIEHSVGLPLIGIVPRIVKFSGQDKARVVATGRDKHSLEAFRAIYSTLKINEESRKAKVFLTTSTIPSEGKSFVSTNLAFIFANHGERTLILDGDLRMPNVAKSLDLENNSGLLQYIAGEKTLDEVIIPNVAPNTDVLTTGGRTKNPTQVLSDERFENLLHELRMRYDKIVIDSPPLAPVSDTLNIVQLADGVVYVVRFNMVKCKTANINIRRLRESNVPIFGCILNNINSSVAGYYYSHYYDRSYKSYYINSHRNSEDDADIVPTRAEKQQKELSQV